MAGGLTILVFVEGLEAVKVRRWRSARGSSHTFPPQFGHVIHTREGYALLDLKNVGRAVMVK